MIRLLLTIFGITSIGYVVSTQLVLLHWVRNGAVPLDTTQFFVESFVIGIVGIVSFVKGIK